MTLFGRAIGLTKIAAQLATITAKQDAQAAQLADVHKRLTDTIQNQGNTIMATLSDIQTEETVVSTDVASVLTLLTSTSAEVTLLQAQLATAVANQDPAALQASLDGLTAIDASLKAALPAPAPAPVTSALPSSTLSTVSSAATATPGAQVVNGGTQTPQS